MFSSFGRKRAMHILFTAAVCVAAAALPTFSAHAQTARVTSLFSLGTVGNVEPSTLTEGGDSFFYGKTPQGGLNNKGWVLQSAEPGLEPPRPHRREYG